MGNDSVEYPGMWSPIGVLQKELERRWRVEEGFEILAMVHGFSAFKSHTGCEDVLRNGPWVIIGQPLSLEQWKLDFQPREEDMPLLSIWLHLPQLPHEY